MKTITYRELADRVGTMYLLNTAPDIDDGLFDEIENGQLEYCICDNTDCDIWGEAEHEKEQTNISQYYLVNPMGAEYLKNHTDEILFWSDVLHEYVWGITHVDTAWEGVNVDIYNTDEKNRSN